MVLMLLNRWYVARVLVDFIPFVIYNRFNVAWPKVTSFLQSIRSTEEGARLPIAVAGFCYGGPFVMKLASNSVDTRTPDGKQPLVDAFFTAHPSNLSVPADIQQVKTNISIANGDQDFVLNMKQVEQVKAALAEMDNVDSEFVLYPGAGHGFAVRADKKSNIKVAEQAEDAEKQAIGMTVLFLILDLAH